MLSMKLNRLVNRAPDRLQVLEDWPIDADHIVRREGCRRCAPSYTKPQGYLVHSLIPSLFGFGAIRMSMPTRVPAGVSDDLYDFFFFGSRSSG
jgi:hypothetical protein